MQNSIAERIDAILATEVTPGGPGAAIAVIRDGQFIHRKAYGAANIEWDVPLTPDAVFRIASVTKQFTAVAIMMLAERGLLSIDAPIETYLTDWTARGRAVTVRQLLNHTSGVWRHDSDQGDRTRRPNPPVEDVLRLICAQPFESEPGERYTYNNSGYMLLGAVIAAVSAKAYEDFLRDEIFSPLGMEDTGLLRPEAITPRRAYGYVRGRKRFHNARLDAMSWSHAAGALGSTLDDLAKWDRAIRSNRLVSSEALETMLTPTTMNDGSVFPYGFGWGVADYEGRRAYHHTGGISGFGAHMLHFRDENLTTIVLSNLYLFPFDKVTRGLIRAALDLDEVGMTPAALSADQFAACAGQFVGDYGREIFAADAGLAFIEGGRPALLPVSSTEFRQADDPENAYRFSDLQGGLYQRFDYLSPLWPVSTFRRATKP
jgi:CubicO group peptidase (beta-lactamase class C family)